MEQIIKTPRTTELPYPGPAACPYETSYSADVLVVGCGYAGLNAAVTAREKGQNVLVVDKGKPGYSGMSPWASSFRWFDPERGDEAEAFRKAVMMGGDYLSNMNWYECWLNESKQIYKRLTEWGILSQYPRAAEAGDFYKKEDYIGYRETFDQFDRRKKWIAVLDKYEIPYLEHTMVTDIMQARECVNGVMAFHVPSGQVISISAKAIVLATGAGCFKPTGYPVGNDTFDGEYMAYQLGLPITGKEFEDFHNTSSVGPGNVFMDNTWPYLENIWLCGGDITSENATDYAASKGNAMVLGRVRNAVYGMEALDEVRISNIADFIYSRRGSSKYYETNPEENRTGRMSSPFVVSDTPGGAVGLCSHLTSGVFCGWDEMDCRSGIPGLFLAGDGTHAANPAGAAYPCGVGFTSCFCSIDGMHAGNAAADYAAHAVLQELSADDIAAKTDEITQPLRDRKGFDANWARDVLHSIMAPYWVSVAKQRETLQAALIQVEYMRDHVIPRLIARNSHDLRQCIEMKHKILSAEMKLRASLAREESRGNHYRADMPYRNDEEFLCYITLRKGVDGDMRIDKVPVPEEWTGDRELPYQERYLYFFPGEPEAKNFKLEQKPGGWRKSKS